MSNVTVSEASRHLKTLVLIFLKKKTIYFLPTRFLSEASFVATEASEDDSKRFFCRDHSTDKPMRNFWTQVLESVGIGWNLDSNSNLKST